MLNFKITSWTGPHQSTNGNLYPINVTAEKLCNAIKSNYYKASYLLGEAGNGAVLFRVHG